VVTLVLFDVDGTLISSGRAGVRGMNRSFEREFGVTGALDCVAVAGRTDRAIVTEALALAGQATDELTIARLRDAYFEDLAGALADPELRAIGVLPGVMALLDHLDTRTDVVVGLLTGNFHRGAAIKLGHFELWSRFAFGAFGDHHTNRRDLVPAAVDAAVAAGHRRFDFSDVIVIGDTPLDVDCAHAHSARAIAVATGPFSHEELVATGAAFVVRTLEEVDADAVLGS
jgi:phosphoglycolate phosphatase-like HAD superfamily hydrolase